MKIGRFLAENSHLARFRVVFSFNGRYLKIYKTRNNFDPSGPNKLKFGLGSLWGSLKKIITRFLIFWFFAIFRALKNAESAKFAKKWRFSDFTGPKNCEKLKYQKSGRWFSSKYPRDCPVQFLAYLDLRVALNIQLCKFWENGN